MRPAFRLALGLALLMPLSGHAQDVTAASAQTIQDQVQARLTGLWGPGTQPGLLAPTVTAEADHYRLTLPIPGLVGDNLAAARLFPLDHDRWRLENIQVPASMHYNMHLPKFAGPDAGGSIAVSIALDGQDSHALIDPTLASRSEIDLDVRDFSLRSDGAKLHQEQRAGRYRVTASLQPGKDGLLDFDEAATLSKWSITSTVTDKPTMSFGADRLSMTARIAGLDRGQAGVLLSAVPGLIATLPAKAASGAESEQLSPTERGALRQLIEGLRGIVTSLRLEETADGLHVTLGGKGAVTIRHMRFGMGGSAPQGLMRTWLDIAIDGLSVADLPPEDASLVPRHVELRPFLTGIPADGIRKLALEATEPDTNPIRAKVEALALLNTVGVSLGLDRLGFDIGPAEVRGTGQVRVSGPMQYQGEARLTATGVDALIDQAHDNPKLRQAIPVLIMLRGFARQEGDHLVWNVVAKDGAVSVNGIELVKPHGHDGEPHPPSR